MAKRKAKTVEPEPVAPPKSAKKGKTKAAPVVQAPIERLTPKKSKTKAEKRLNASVVEEKPPFISPSNKSKVHQKHSRNNSMSDESMTSSSKKNKHRKERNSPVKSLIKSPVKVEVDENDDEVDEEEEVLAAPLCELSVEHEIDLMEIPKGDLEALLSGIKKVLPDNDRLNPKVRARKLEWNKVAFGDYTAERCAKIWDAIQKRQRQYRFMSELIADALVWLETPWHSAKNKSQRHPDYPKRPQSAFLLYLADAKASIMRDNKNAKIPEISRIAGQKYKQLSESAREVYLKRAAVDMRKHDEEVELFYKKHPNLKTEATPKYAGPKKARTPFALFLEDHLSKEEYVSDKNAYRMASKEVWNNMKAKKKVPWIRKAVTEYQNYLQEVEVYNIEHPSETVKPMKTVLNKEEVHMLNKAEGKPEKPPTSAYMFYTQQMLRSGEFNATPSKDRLKAIAGKWSQESKDTKEQYEKLLHEMQEKYNKEYKVYLDQLPEEKRAQLLLESEKKKKKTDTTKKEKRHSISKRDVTVQALPKHWTSMTEDDKQVYMSALNRVRDYFETKLNESVKMEDVPEAETEAPENDQDEESSAEESAASESEESDSDASSD